MPVSIKKAQENIGYSKNPWSYTTKGRYYSSAITSYTLTTLGVTADYLYAVPLLVGRRSSFDRIWIEVTTAGAAGTLARLGIYATDEGVYPRNLVLDAGTVAIDAIGVKEIIIDSTLPPGLYWLVFVCSGAPALRALVGYIFMGFLLGSSGAGNTVPASGYYVAFTFGALPANFPSGGTFFSGNGFYVQLRRK